MVFANDSSEGARGIVTSILYTEVKRGRRNRYALEPGHWFFHEGQWAVCASTGEVGRQGWRLTLYWEVANKPRPEQPLIFKTLGEVKAFVSEYFGHPVVDRDPNDMPAPDGL
jgi:hypothetical protein